MISIRELHLADIFAVARLADNERFAYPALTGRLAAKRPLAALSRAFVYVLRCVLANRFGAVLFGMRLHWIMAIVDAERGFVGIVMIDELVRYEPPDEPWHSAALKRSDRRLGLRPGDGEIGIFLDPSMSGQGAASIAIGLLIRLLTAKRDIHNLPLLRRVWAETGADNTAARKLLERLGLELDPTAETASVMRYHRDGQRIRLVHYRQTAADEAAEPTCPALCIARRIERATADRASSDVS